MYKRPIYYLQRTWYIGRPSTTHLVYWSIGHPVLAHMSDNRLVQETYNWGVGTLTVIFRGKNRYLKKCNRGRRLLEFLICWRNIYVLLANTKKNICFKTTTKHSQRKQELYWQMQRQGVKMSNYFYLWKHTPFTVTLALHPWQHFRTWNYHRFRIQILFWFPHLSDPEET